MATIKSHTDLGQSKKLAEFLPLESADMHYDSGDDCEIRFGRGMYEEIADWICEGTPRPADIPCWSLAALLSVLPRYELNNFGDAIQLDVKREALETEDDETLLDLVVNMIIHLHELKKL